jgi:general secretion pathway protein G
MKIMMNKTRVGMTAQDSKYRHPVTPSPRHPFTPSAQGGFTLFELVVTVAILAILTLGAIPLMQVSVKRQKEQELREALRDIRQAIKEFHRDTIGSPCTGLTGAGQGGGQIPGIPNQPNRPNPGVAQLADPRSRVAVCDPEIFTVDNPDKYPPSLQTLVDGVTVIPRGANARLGGGQGLGGTKGILDTQDSATEQKIKKYLRELPIDPMTGKDDWVIRSCYQDKDAEWDGINVFDVRSRSEEKALNGEKYSEW